MKINTLSTSGINPVVILLGILAILLIFAELTGKKIPVLSTDRAALLGLIAMGLVICAFTGIGPVSTNNGWLHPLSIIGYLLGGVIVIIGGAALIGKQIPPLSNYHQAFIAVTVITVIKIALTTFHRRFL